MPQKKKKGSLMKWTVGLIVLLPIVFVAAVFLLLASKGQLKAEVIGKIPGMGKILASDAGATKDGGGAVTTLEGPFASEFSGLLKELNGEIVGYKAKRAQVEAQESRLKMFQEDQEALKQKLEEMQKTLLQAVKDLEERENALDRKMVLLKQNEQDNFKKSAETYKSMEPNKAADILQRMDDEDVVKILGLMESRARAKVLEAMTAEKAAELTQRMKTFRKEVPGKES